MADFLLRFFSDLGDFATDDGEVCGCALLRSARRERVDVVSVNVVVAVVVAADADAVDATEDDDDDGWTVVVVFCWYMYLPQRTVTSSPGSTAAFKRIHRTVIL